MTQIMGQGCRFSYICVDPEFLSHVRLGLAQMFSKIVRRSRDLKRMGEPVAKDVVLVYSNDLRDCAQPSESRRKKNALRISAGRIQKASYDLFGVEAIFPSFISLMHSSCLIETVRIVAGLRLEVLTGACQRQLACNAHNLHPVRFPPSGAALEWMSVPLSRAFASLDYRATSRDATNPLRPEAPPQTRRNPSRRP